MLTREQEQVADEFALAHGRCAVDTPYRDAPTVIVCTAPDLSQIEVRANGQVKRLHGAGLISAAPTGEEDS